MKSIRFLNSWAQSLSDLAPVTCAHESLEIFYIWPVAHVKQCARQRSHSLYSVARTPPLQERLCASKYWQGKVNTAILFIKTL